MTSVRKRPENPEARSVETGTNCFSLSLKNLEMNSKVRTKDFSSPQGLNRE